MMLLHIVTTVCTWIVVAPLMAFPLTCKTKKMKCQTATIVTASECNKNYCARLCPTLGWVWTWTWTWPTERNVSQHSSVAAQLIILLCIHKCIIGRVGVFPAKVSVQYEYELSVFPFVLHWMYPCFCVFLWVWLSLSRMQTFVCVYALFTGKFPKVQLFIFDESLNMNAQTHPHVTCSCTHSRLHVLEQIEMFGRCRITHQLCTYPHRKR